MTYKRKEIINSA